MVFEDNDGGVDYNKVILHAKSRDVYMNDKEALIKVGFYVEFFGSGRNKVIWEVVDDNVVEEGKYRDDIGIQGFDFYFLTKMIRELLEKD